MKKDALPLVSVPVVTYNSSATIIETLDSIYNQTYPNLELIISDDCSKDDTVKKCSAWIDAHKDRFVHTELITVPENTGVSANLNRAEKACKGEWIKGIAGDDVMLPDCISDNVQFIQENPQAMYVFSRIVPFGNNKPIVDSYMNNDIFDYTIFDKSTEDQLNAFVLEDKHIPAPSVFYNKPYSEKLAIRLDERLPLIDDEPRWINVLKTGTHLYFFDKVTVKYRVGDADALSSPIHVLSPKQFESMCRFYFYYKFPTRYQRDPEQAIEQMIGLISYNYRIAYEFKKEKNAVTRKLYDLYANTWFFKEKIRRYLQLKAKQ